MTSEARHWIDGEWTSGGAAEHRGGVCIDPATGKVAGGYAEGGAREAEAAIAAARRAFETTAWAHAPRLRAEVLSAFADRLAARRDEVERLLTRLNGKLLRESAGEVAAGVSELRYYAGLARNLFGRFAEVDDGRYSVLAREPAGVAGIIVPWNAPVTLLVRSLAPALAAGCTSVVKPAPQTSPVTAIVLECLAAVPALPRGVVNAVNESGSAVAEALVRSPEVDVVSFTGSTATGKRIMAAAAGTLKRLSLELGGKAPAVVFEDADPERTAAAVAAAATVMAGQMCTAASRVLVQERLVPAVRDRLARIFERLVVGPGDDPASQMGPMIDRANQDRILTLVEAASAEGTVVVRGRAPGGTLAAGAFVTPTLVEVSDLDSRLVQEELFGPVLVLERFGDEEEAVRRANATRYGLAASVWTNDQRRAHRVARALRSGTVWINAHNRLFAEAETGGYRESGLGRLHGVEGLDDFLQTKHVYFETLTA